MILPLYLPQHNDVDNVIEDTRIDKAYIFFRMGDYEKAVEESDRGIASSLRKKDSLYFCSY